MNTKVEFRRQAKHEPQTEQDGLSGWKSFGTIGYEKYMSFLLNGGDAGVELEMVA